MCATLCGKNSSHKREVRLVTLASILLTSGLSLSKSSSKKMDAAIDKSQTNATKGGVENGRLPTCP